MRRNGEAKLFVHLKPGNIHISIFCRILLKSPNKPDKSLDKHKAVEDQAEHDWNCDYPNEDYHDGSGNFF